MDSKLVTALTDVLRASRKAKQIDCTPRRVQILAKDLAGAVEAVQADSTPDFDFVMVTARRWYYSDVRSLADSALAEIAKRRAEDKDTDAREWLDEYLRETLDGYSTVIYTAQAEMAVAASDNSDAWEDVLEGSPTASQRCYFAMLADVWQLLEARSDEWETVESEEADDLAE